MEGPPKETWSDEKISKNVDFSLWGNRATMQTHFWNWNIFSHFSSQRIFFFVQKFNNFFVVIKLGFHSNRWTKCHWRSPWNFLSRIWIDFQYDVYPSRKIRNNQTYFKRTRFYSLGYIEIGPGRFFGLYIFFKCLSNCL